MKVLTEFEHPHPKVDFKDSPSLTRQEFAEEANVNNLMKRYALTGSFYDPLGHPSKSLRKPMFGDFTQFGDFQESQNRVIAAMEAFDSLPVELRKRFNYDPQALIEFCSDPKNRDEAIKLGLIEKAAEAATPEPPKAAKASEEAVEEVGTTNT